MNRRGLRIAAAPVVVVKILAFATLLLACPALRADLIACEGFDYQSGASLNGRTGGTGWKGAWFGADGVPGVVTAEPGLAFPKLLVSGLRSIQDGKDTRVFRYLDAERPEVAPLVEAGAAGKTFGKDGTTIWISFLIACTSYPKVAHGGIHLMDGVELGADYKKTQRIQMGRQNTAKHWYLGRVDRGGPAAGTWDGTVVADATVRLLVYRFDFKPGPEEGWMWVDPEPGKEPDPARADIHAPSMADFRFNAVNVGSGGGAIYVFDELRIGTTCADVAPAAKTVALAAKAVTASANAVVLAAPAAETKVLFDFENAGDAKDWTMVEPPECELKEPPAKVEISTDGATSGKCALKIVFDGGHLPAVTTGKLAETDWMPWAVLRADVTVKEPCVVGLRVLQKKATRINGWSKQITRWQKVVELKPGKTTIAGVLHPNELSPIRADSGSVVALDIFTCSPAKGQTIYVDNVRLDTVLPPELAPKPEVKTDFGVYPQPPAPVLPKAGETLTDPTFGTTLLRVTDESDGNCQNAYSYWPSFNKDSTLFHIQREKDGPTLYRFDPQAFKITGKEPLFARDPGLPGGINWEDCTWSGVDPKVIFGHGGAVLASYSVDAKKFTVIKDFSRDFPGLNLAQISRSADDQVFGFTLKTGPPKYADVGYAVWRRDTGKVLLHVETTNLDEVQVDKTGRYCVVKTEEQGPGKLNVLVYDLETGKHEDLTDDGPDFSPGHSDNGHALIVGADNYRNSLTFRRCATPHRHYMVMDTFSGHLSMLADDEGWALVSGYYDKPPVNQPWGTFAQEIYLVATDGSQRVRRLAHHFSEVKGSYWNSPRADISRDGKFVVFTSNWGTGTRGVFILRVP